MGASQRADLYTLYLSARHVSSLGDISALGAGTESRNEDKSAQGGGSHTVCIEDSTPVREARCVFCLIAATMFCIISSHAVVFRYLGAAASLVGSCSYSYLVPSTYCVYPGA